MHKKLRSICLMCNIECKRHTTKFCSRECLYKYIRVNHIHHGGPKTILQYIHCPVCKILFKPISSKTKYCSRKCAGKARWARNDRKWNTAGIIAAKNMLPSQKAKLAVAMARRMKSRNSHAHIGIGGIREDIGHYVRSRWEANICRILIKLDISYKYESVSFNLSYNDERYVYTPDMQISDNVFIEVKGWETAKSQRKKELIQLLYPDIYIIYIDSSVYRKLSAKYMNIIDNWEKDKKHGI